LGDSELAAKGIFMNVLFVGDVVGKGGRAAVKALVPELRREYTCSFCIANIENVAGGAGITRACVDDLTGIGVDVFTTGDHVWDQHDFVEQIEGIPNLLRPGNVCAAQPGRGYGLFPVAGGGSVGVVCLLGRVFMNGVADCPFQAADRTVEELRAATPFVIVDFHAEATSEKTALARFLDGRVSAVLGTHTHVPTADATVLPGGTAFQCDVGMVGARESILGRDIGAVVHRFSTGMPARFKVVDKGIRLHATVVSLDAQGRATAVQPLTRDQDA
jgi:metallophosphoesterase (TIGR00282 family)